MSMLARFERRRLTKHRRRLDKFYLLIRRFVHAGFLLLKREEWDPTAMALYAELLTGPGGPLQCALHPFCRAITVPDPPSRTA